MAGDLKCSPGDKPISVEEYTAKDEKTQRTVYGVMAVVVFLLLFYMSQVNRNSLLEQGLVRLCAGIVRFFAFSSKDAIPILAGDTMQKMVRRHISFALMMAIFVCLMVSAFICPLYGAKLKSRHSTQNGQDGKAETSNILTAMLVMIFLFSLMIIGANFKSLRSQFMFFLLAGIIYFLFLLFRLYRFNTNVFHMSLQTLIWYFSVISLLGFMYFSYNKGTTAHYANYIVSVILITVISGLTYFIMEMRRDDTKEYLVDKHRVARIFIYIIMACVVILFTLFQGQTVFDMARADFSFAPYAGIPEFFNSKTGAILERITDVRLKIFASAFVYLGVGIVSFFMGSGKMVIGFLQELKASV